MRLKRNWIQIVAWALCVVLAVGLVIMVRVDQKRSNERIQAMQQQAIEAEMANSEKLEALRDLYDQFYSQWEMNSFVAASRIEEERAVSRTYLICVIFIGRSPPQFRLQRCCFHHPH